MTRNPYIAAVLHEVNLAETKGSGIRVMRQLMEEIGLTPPTFESDRSKDQFVATMLFHHFLGPEDWKWLQSLNVPAPIDEEARALVYVRETLTIDNATYRDLNRVDVLNASNHLRRLRDQGLLEQRGKGSATYYVPTERLIASLSLDSGLSAKPPSLSGNLQPLSGNPGPLSGNLPPNLPTDLANRILALGQRVSQPELAQLTIDLCRHRSFSADELAGVFGKSRKHVLERALTPLIRQGLLHHTIPDQPNHPNQAYIAAKE